MMTSPLPVSPVLRRVKPSRPRLALLAVVPLVAWGLGSGAFIMFHDRMLAALLSRQAAMQDTYEDRIASLRDALEAAKHDAAAQALGRNAALSDLYARADRLERQSAVLDAMIGTPSRAHDLGLRASTGPVDGADTSLASSVAVSETKQRLRIDALRARTERTNARIQTALDALGLATPDRDGADSGGPFVPLADAGLGADDEMATLRTALARQRQLEAVASRLPLRQPVSGPLDVTSGFGARRDPFLGRLALHTGIDLREAYGSPVAAVASGTVTIAGPETGYGSLVEIDHGNGYATRYAHLSTIGVAVGQNVAAGAVIGQIGTSGRSTGPHLHYEIRIAGEPVDPARYLDLATAMAAP